MRRGYRLMDEAQVESKVTEARNCGLFVAYQKPLTNIFVKIVEYGLTSYSYAHTFIAMNG